MGQTPSGYFKALETTVSKQETTNEGGYVTCEHPQRRGRIYDGVPEPAIPKATSKGITGFRLAVDEFSGGETGQQQDRHDPRTLTR
jgi:hypothetical protein